MSVELAVQKAVIQASTAALAAAGKAAVPVYDHVPQQQAFPLVALDRHQVLSMDGAEMHGFEHTITLAVWSDYRGQKEAWEILAALWKGLHDKTLLLEEGIHVLCQVSDRSCQASSDGVTYEGLLTANILTHPVGDY